MTAPAPRLADAAAQSHAPEQALKALEQIAQRSDGAGAIEQSSDLALRRTAQLLCLGGALAEWLLFQPALIAELEGDEAPTEEGLKQRLESFRRDHPGELQALRQRRRAETLRIAAAEILPEARRLNFEQASALLSQLAAQCVEAVLEQLGLTEDFAVIALGKLGGWELNYSSDIDLLYLSRFKDSRHESRARLLTRDIEAPSANGRMFRVDLRLRPYGRSGAIAPSVSSACNYYLKRASAWERQALIRACHLAGDEQLSQEFFEGIKEFVWERELDSDAIHSIVELRKRTEKTVEDPEWHLKQGPGGIREIEFAVQFLQLRHGARHKPLRRAGTCPAIRALLAGQFITDDEASALIRSYTLQRRLEHLLQLRYDREEERLPKDGELRELLAAFIGTPTAQLLGDFQRSREESHKFLSSLLHKPFEDQSNDGHDIRDLLLAREVKLKEGQAWMEEHGFKDGLSAFKNLRKLGVERNRFLAPSGRAQTLLAGLAPALVEALAASSNPDRSLKNLALAVDTLGAKATFLELLLEADDALTIFTRLAETSDFLIQTLARQPGVLDEVLDRLQTKARISEELLTADCQQAIERAEPLRALAQIKAINTLHVGILDLGGRYNAQNIGRDLSLLAEAIVASLLELAHRELSERFQGRPKRDDGEDVRFAVLAVGKLGGAEITYGSDYDLIFVHEGPGRCPNGARALDYFHALGQVMLRLGNHRDGDSVLAPIDLRLRPAGQQSLLSCSLKAALRYYSGEATGDRAANWERLALTKLRGVAGDRAFTDHVVEQLKKARLLYGDHADLWDEILEMRQRQHATVDKNDIKIGPGGLADIEFVSSALALRYGSQDESLRATGTAQLIGALGQAGYLSQRQTQELLTSYQFLRTLEARLRVLSGQPGSKLPKAPARRRDLALRLGYIDAAQSAEEMLEEELSFQRATVRRACQEIIADDRERQKLHHKADKSFTVDPKAGK